MRFDSIAVLDEHRPRSGPWNMAADELLLCSGAFVKPVLRFYRWSEPTVSLGYFESFSAGETDPSRPVAMVRRWTGGGIVHHGEDLTYSLIVPALAVPRLSAREVYGRVHGLLCDVLCAAGIQAELAGEGGEAESRECFRSPVVCDVLVGGRKVAGAGQRWTRAGLLHQGSIQGLALPANFRSELAVAFAEQAPEEVELSDGLKSEIDSLALSKYARDDWLRRVA